MRPESAESFIADVLRSQEFRDGLRARLIAGTCKANELAIAERLGLAAEAEDPAEAERQRESMRAVPRETRRTLMEICRLSTTSPGELRLIEAGDWVGVGYSLSTRARAEAEARRGTGPAARYADPVQRDPERAPTGMTADEVDLLPQAWPRT